MVSVGSSTCSSGKRIGLRRVAQRDADADLLDAGDQHDVAGLGFVGHARARRPSNTSTWLTLAPAPAPSSGPFITTTSWPGRDAAAA